MPTYHPVQAPGTGQLRRTPAPAPRARTAICRPVVDGVPGRPSQPMAAAVTKEMEARPDTDFSRIPVHTDSAARASAAKLGVHAYSSGPHAPGDGGADTHIPAPQCGIGDAVVSRMLQGAPHQHGAGCSHQRAAPAPVQRSAVHDVLSRSGQPLAGAVKEEMEARLGGDFSRVRVHTDAAARASAVEVGARAYTSGSHVVIGDRGADKHTLAHELYHVKQQSEGPVAGTPTDGGLAISDPSDPYERAAQRAAEQIASPPRSSARPPDLPPRIPHAPAGAVSGFSAIPAQQNTTVIQRTIVHSGGEPYDDHEVEALRAAYPSQSHEIDQAHQDTDQEYTATGTRRGVTLAPVHTPGTWHWRMPEEHVATVGEDPARNVGPEFGLTSLKRTPMPHALTASIIAAEPAGMTYMGTQTLAGGAGLRESGLARTHHLADSSIATIVQYLHQNRNWDPTTSGGGQGVNAVRGWLNALTGGSNRNDLFQDLMKARTSDQLRKLVNDLSNNAWNVGIGSAPTNTALGGFFDESRTPGGRPTPAATVIAMATRQLAAHGVVPEHIIDAALAQLVDVNTGEIMHSMTATVTSGPLGPARPSPVTPVTTVPLNSPLMAELPASMPLPNPGRYEPRNLSPYAAVTLMQQYARRSQIPWAQYLADLDPSDTHREVMNRVAAFVVSPNGGIDVELHPGQ